MSLEAFGHKTFRELYFFSVTILNQQKGEMLLEGGKKLSLMAFPSVAYHRSGFFQ